MFLALPNREKLIKACECECTPLPFKSRAELLNLLDSGEAQHFLVFDIASSIRGFLKNDALVWQLRSDVVAVDDPVSYLR